MTKARSVIRRIPRELEDILVNLKSKNKLPGKGVIESGKMAADLLNGLKSKDKIIEKIRREIEF